MKPKEFHLNEDQILCSVVDEKDLTVNMQYHLSACPVCHQKKQQFGQELGRLGLMAKAFAPLPREKVRLLEKPGFFEKFGFYPIKKAAFAAGFAVVLIMAGITWQLGTFTDSQEKMMTHLVWEMEDDQQLMVEIRELEEYELPDFYLDIYGGSHGYFDEEFLNFVAPLEENQGSPVGSIRFISFIG